MKVNPPRPATHAAARFAAACLLTIVRTVAAADVPDPSSACAPASQSDSRRRPGVPEAQPPQTPPCDPHRLPLPHAEQLPGPEPLTNRWRIVESLGYEDNRADPYAGNNPLKGDRPVFGTDWFTGLSAASSSLLEPRQVPAGAGLGNSGQLFFSETANFDAILYKGDTVFRPPDYQFRFSPAVNYNRTRTDAGSSGSTTFAVQALFFEKHLRDVSPQYDFDSVRVGIQPVTTDFRGFLMLDQPVGVRLFGTRANDVYQYNLGWFRPLAKNAARLNDIGATVPHDDIFMANLYRQDLFVPGFNSELAVIYERNRAPGAHLVAGSETAGAAPTFASGARHDYDITYLGYSGDGHFGRLNFTGSLYYALGRESPGMLVQADTSVRAFFAAGEFSVDFDWTRLRFSALHASGDANPRDRRATGFAGLNSSPIFAGTDSSFFLHQRLPLGGGLDLKQRDRLFDDLRPSAAGAQSSSEGPGLTLLGIGADLDITPTVRISADANQLWFAAVAPLQVVTGRTGIAKDIGQDVSLNAFYRPFDTQNLILRLTGAVLNPGRGYRSLYGSGTPYSAFFNIIVTY
jgi:hypothetical protein